MNCKISIICALLAIAFEVSALKKDTEFLKACQHGADTMFTMKVLDDSGNAVSNASVRVRMGMFFAVNGYWIEGHTDNNGNFKVSGKTCGNEILIFVTKEGYYPSKKKLCYIKMGEERNVAKGKWQPYGDVLSFQLRKICKPVDMLQMRLRKFNQTKILNQWIGYDLGKHDFVSPHGAGEQSDFDVLFDWNGKWLPEYDGMILQIRFPDSHAGYYSVKAIKTSDFVGPYHALHNASYQKTSTFHDKVLPDGRNDTVNFDDDKCWVVRSRCKVDEQGRLVSANYSVVYKIEYGCDLDGVALISVISAFNPTPNDTNLEARQWSAMGSVPMAPKK